MFASDSAFGRFLTLAVTIGSAALCADLCAAAIGAYCMEAPGRIEIVDAGHGASSAGLREADRRDFGAAMRQPAPVKPKKVVVKTASSGSSRSRRKSRRSAPADKRNLAKAVFKGSLISPYSRAVIMEIPSSQGNETVLVAQNEPIGGYVLTEVGQAWARFENDTEEMLFIGDSMNPDAGGDKASAPIVKKRTVVVSDSPTEEPTEEEKPQDSGAPVTMDDVRYALDNSAEMANQLRVVPEEKDGVPYGTRVSFKDSNNLLSRMGVEDNDILLSINGTPTRSAEEMYRGYMTLRNADAFEFVVDRGGTEQTIRYELAR